MRRRRQRLVFLLTLGVCLAISFVASLIMLMGANNARSRQQARLDFLTKEIGAANGTLQNIKDQSKSKEGWVTQLNTIHRLQTARFVPVRILNELTRITPADVTMLKFARAKGSITLDGQAKTNANITRLVNNIRQSKCFVEPKLSKISLVNVKVQRNAQRERRFTVTMLLKPQTIQD